MKSDLSGCVLHGYRGSGIGYRAETAAQIIKLTLQIQKGNNNTIYKHDSRNPIPDIRNTIYTIHLFCKNRKKKDPYICFYIVLLLKSNGGCAIIKHRNNSKQSEPAAVLPQVREV